MKYKMIVTDLDGTLMPIGHTYITDRAMNALRKAHEEGIIITVATGRGITGLPKQLLDEGLIDYAIACNGATVHDVRSGEKLRSQTLDTDTAITIMKRILSENIYVGLYIDGKELADKENIKRFNEYFVSEAVTNMLLKVISEIKDSLIDYVIEERPAIEKILCFFNKDEMDTKWRLKEEISSTYGDVEVCAAVYNNMEISSDQATKGNGLEFLADYLDIDLSEIAAFGDGDNDVSMLKLAGLRVAPESACIEAREVANVICDLPENEGIIKIIEEQLL